MISAFALLALLVAGQMTPGQAGGDEVSALVARIREGLAKVDETLLSTLDDDDPRARLDDAVRQHQEVIRDLEELIRQAKYQRSNQGGGGGGGGGGGQDQSPQQQQQDQQQQSRESDGSNSDQQDSGAQPPSPGEQQGGEQPGEGQQDQAEAGEQPQGQPEDGGASDSAADNRDGPPPPPADKINPLTATGDERWGLLPPKLQERLVNLHVDDVPPRYRDWLSAYIRAMRKVEEQEGP